MIHFMPFTYLSESMIDRLHAVFGPVSVCRPLADLASEVVLKAADDGRLRLCPPEGVDQRRLRQSLRAFTDWAAAHQGRPGDLTGFFRSRQLHRSGRGEDQDESDARQIHAQLRRRTDGVPPDTADPVFEAALFLCLAHTYDQQQATLNLDLGKVHALEENFGRILGETDAAETGIGPSLADDPAPDHGAYMTRRRLASWARVVFSHADDESGFVTTSAAVMEDIQELWPAMRPVARIPIPAKAAGGSSAPISPTDLMRSGYLALAQAEDPGAAAVDLFGDCASVEPGAFLSVYAVQGCPPRDFILSFIDKKQDDINAAGQAPPPRNTVIGHFSF